MLVTKQFWLPLTSIVRRKKNTNNICSTEERMVCNDMCNWANEMSNNTYEWIHLHHSNNMQIWMNTDKNILDANFKL